METIQTLRLMPFTNSLYAQFMNDVNHHPGIHAGDTAHYETL